MNELLEIDVIYIMIYGIFLVVVCNQRSDRRPDWDCTDW